MMVVSILIAQNEERGVRNRENMRSALSLDEKQDAAAKSINRKYATRQAELRKETRESRNALRSEREREFEALLTPEQKVKWEEIKATRVQERNQAHETAAAERQAELKSALELTDDQALKLNEANKTFAEKRKKLLEEPGTVDGAAIKKLREEHQEAVKKVLSEEQLKKLKEMRRKDRRSRR